MRLPIGSCFFYKTNEWCRATCPDLSSLCTAHAANQFVLKLCDTKSPDGREIGYVSPCRSYSFFILFLFWEDKGFLVKITKRSYPYLILLRSKLPLYVFLMKPWSYLSENDYASFYHLDLIKARSWIWFNSYVIGESMAFVDPVLFWYLYFGNKLLPCEISSSRMIYILVLMT